MIPRTLEARLREVAGSFPVVTLVGPRQSGKTTLVRAAFSGLPYVSLERPDERRYALEDPRGFLARFPDGAVLDEIQRAPELTSFVQVLVDADPRPGRFVLTGSENLTVTARTAQSLAGRTAMLRLLPLDLAEMRAGPRGQDELSSVLWRGGYPALHDRDVGVGDWLGAYIETYVERDARQLLRIGDLVAFQTFVGLCAGRTGNLLNLSSLASDCGISHVTAKSWLSVLEASFLTFRLPPWASNPNKRLIKSPKLYFWDTGLVCHLLGIREPGQLDQHPLRGAIFETWVVSELLKQDWHRGRSPRAWFYRERGGLEADLLIEREDRLLVVEAKSGRTVPQDALSTERRVAQELEDINPSFRLHPLLVYGGREEQTRTHGHICPWTMLDRWAAGLAPSA